jgi:integrase/recombinase XerD
MTQLHRKMLEELQRRNYLEITARKYLQVVTNLAQHFGKSPDKLGPDHLRTCEAHLLKGHELAVGTVANCVAALRLPQSCRASGKTTRSITEKAGIL